MINIWVRIFAKILKGIFVFVWGTIHIFNLVIAPVIVVTYMLYTHGGRIAEISSPVSGFVDTICALPGPPGAIALCVLLIAKIIGAISIMAVVVFVFVRLPMSLGFFNAEKVWGFLFIDAGKTVNFFAALALPVVYCGVLISFDKDIVYDIIEASALSTMGHNVIFTIFLFRRVIAQHRQWPQEFGRIYLALLASASVMVCLALSAMSVGAVVSIETNAMWIILFFLFLAATLFENWRFCRHNFEKLIVEK